MKTALTSHLEDYLESILEIARDSGEAHASVIAERMGVTRASVTGALRALSERDLIVYQPYQPVSLTPQGKLAAQACADRHQFLHGFFRDHLGMEDVEAEEVACKVEHSANSTVLSRLAEFSRFLTDCRRIELTWGPDGTLHCASPQSIEACDHCSRCSTVNSD